MPERSRILRDLNQLAADEATAHEPIAKPEPKKNPHAQALGRLGGLKGGKARAARLSAEQRTQSARKAAEARWRKSR